MRGKFKTDYRGQDKLWQKWLGNNFWNILENIKKIAKMVLHLVGILSKSPT